MKEKEPGWSIELTSWVGLFIAVTVIYGFILYAALSSVRPPVTNGLAGYFSLKLGDLLWFIGVYILGAFMFEWGRYYKSLDEGGKILWITLWLYIFAGGVFLISITAK